MDDIRKFLIDNRAGGSGEFSESDSLLEQGVIDSVAMVDLITFLESRYDIRINDDEMTPENFDSLNAIVAFVRSKKPMADSVTET